MKAQSNSCFTSYETYLIAKKQVIKSITYRFPSISFGEIEEIVSDAFIVVNDYEKAGKLSISQIGYAKTIAFNKATDYSRKQATLRRQGVSFVDADFAKEMPFYTEGGYFENTDDNTAVCLAAITNFLLTLPKEAAMLFDADSDSVLSKMTDRALANYLDFKIKTESATKKKRFDVKRKTIRMLESTSQFQRLKIVHERRQVA